MEKILNFSQKTAIILAKEKLNLILFQARQMEAEVNNLVNQIAIEQGIQLQDFNKWKLSDDNSKLILINKEPEKIIPGRKSNKEVKHGN